MRLKAVLFGFITFCGLNHSVFVSAQTVTARTDSAIVATPKPDPDKDRIIKTEKDKGLSKPGRAALFSAVLPGLGQVYNGHYWKVPVIYAVGGTLGYLIVWNNDRYQDYSQAYLYSIDNNTETEPTIKDEATSLSTNALRNGRDLYRRNRDLSVILLVLAYGLNIMEANVGAHLNEFDISDDLSMNWQPSIQYAAFGTQPTPGLSLHFRLKK
ncbi:hypothetical protein I5M27_17320 [Adhaeribacter sp. BT258]|uniref:DUF5683 domain-containing protein n=1 Tax=Adhaeribacter terrigena TaxID=2793070 RepID=A0ABS1C5U5_9BACT|nr:DUF5683 domain-containing protein [Adhaeribacter terrigena]MBK0404758.1 hypothetical protein [Adhaeribacter terrigena]